MNKFFCLIGCHLLADYPLQGDFLSKAKNKITPIPGVPWYQALFAHSAIHGFFVGLITKSCKLGVLETLLHFFIDHAKCHKKISYNQDQFLHVLCKLIYVLCQLKRKM